MTMNDVYVSFRRDRYEYGRRIEFLCRLFAPSFLHLSLAFGRCNRKAGQYCQEWVHCYESFATLISPACNLMLWVFFASIVQWGLRFRYDRSAAVTDACYVIVSAIWHCRHSVQDACHMFYSFIILQGGWSLYLHLICGILCLQCLSCIFNYQQYCSSKKDNHFQEDARLESSKTQEEFLLKPLLISCRTSHTRLFPKKHSFSYSYLLVGVPIGWRGSVGNVLAADLNSLLRGQTRQAKAWFCISSSDYLGRGDSPDGLRGKLDRYLKSQVRTACKEVGPI